MPEGNVLKFPDLLRVEGVMAKGYGIICKFPMTDPDLKVQAKGIYAYLCACCGNGATAFPSISKITDHLQISKDTYYKAVKQLKEQGYIQAKQQKVANGQFANNIYTIVSNPKKFQDSGYEAKGTLHTSLAFTGLKMAGYGMIPRTVMYDARLSVTAKVLYAYLASFSGAGKVAFPAKSYIQKHLGIGDSTYKSNMRALTSTNYVTVIQRHVNGKLSSNDYYLNDNPDEAAVLAPEVARKTKAVTCQRVKIPDTVQRVKIQEAVQQETDRQESAGQETVQQEAGREDTTNNSSLINNFPNIIPSINRAEHWTDGLSKEELLEILIAEAQPYTRRDELKIHLSDTQINYFLNLIIEFIQSRKNLNVRGVWHDRGEVIDKFLSLGVEDYEYIKRKVETVSSHIKNLRGYYLACLYFAKEDYTTEIDRQVVQDS